MHSEVMHYEKFYCMWLDSSTLTMQFQVRGEDSWGSASRVVIARSPEGGGPSHPPSVCIDAWYPLILCTPESHRIK